MSFVLKENQYVWDANVPVPKVLEKEHTKQLYGDQYENISLILPEGIEIIDRFAFENCVSLKEVNIPKSVKKVGNGPKVREGAFAGCPNLTTIILHEGLEYILHAAFKDCASLKEINIPKSVKYLGKEAFAGCSNLTDVTLPEGIEIIGRTFDNFDSLLTAVSSAGGLELIDTNAFKDCVSLKEISIPKKISEIGIGVFEGCSNLTEVNLPEGLEFIQEWAFKNCVSLKEINIPKSVREIRGGAFEGCSNLTTVILQEGLVVIDDSAFKDCFSFLPKEIFEKREKKILNNKDQVIFNYRELNKRLDEGETETLIDDFRNVVDEMEECINLNDPVIIGAFTNMGDLYLKVGDYKQAAVYFEKIIESLPKIIVVWFVKINIFFDLLSIYKKLEDIDNYNRIKKEIGLLVESLQEEDYFFEMLCYSQSANDVYDLFIKLKEKLNELNIIFDLGGDEDGGDVGFLFFKGKKIPVLKWSYSQFDSDYIMYLDIGIEEELLEEIFKGVLSSEYANCKVYYGNFEEYEGHGRIVSIDGPEYISQVPGNFIQIQLLGEGSLESKLNQYDLDSDDPVPI